MTDTYQPIIQNLLKTHAKPAICLYREFPPVHPVTTLSKFGGWPNLPADVDWPRGTDPYAEHFRGLSDNSWHEAPPLHFLAQIDCSELPDAQSELPRIGMLFFFGRLDEECVWDDGQPNESTRVIYIRDFDRATPLRHPPNDIWSIGERTLLTDLSEVEAFDEGAVRGPGRIVLDVNELAIVPEWPIKSANFESYPDPQHFTFGPVEGAPSEERHAFGEAYREARQMQVSENIATATGHSQPPLRPLSNMSYYNTLAIRAYEKNVWHNLPHELQQTLPALAAFVQSLIVHICHELIERQERLKRDKKRGTEPAFEKLENYILQAKRWLRICAGLSVAETLPEKMSDGFIQFLDQLADDTYSFDYERDNGEIKQITSEVVRLSGAYYGAMIDLGRRAASDATLCDALPAQFFVYLDFIADRTNPLRPVSHSTPHQMLGHVTSSQIPLPIDDDEVLLLHLYSDSALRFCWWDVGEVTYRIKASDLKKLNFEKAWATIQG